MEDEETAQRGKKGKKWERVKVKKGKKVAGDYMSVIRENHDHDLPQGKFFWREKKGAQKDKGEKIFPDS